MGIWLALNETLDNHRSETSYMRTVCRTKANFENKIEHTLWMLSEKIYSPYFGAVGFEPKNAVMTYLVSLTTHEHKRLKLEYHRFLKTEMSYSG